MPVGRSHKSDHVLFKAALATRHNQSFVNVVTEPFSNLGVPLIAKVGHIPSQFTFDDMRAYYFIKKWSVCFLVNAVVGEAAKSCSRLIPKKGGVQKRSGSEPHSFHVEKLPYKWFGAKLWGVQILCVEIGLSWQVNQRADETAEILEWSRFNCPDRLHFFILFNLFYPALIVPKFIEIANRSWLVV